MTGPGFICGPHGPCFRCGEGAGSGHDPSGAGDSLEDEVPVDLSWKTQQDKGRWIDEMGIAGDSKSLILVINNLEMESSEEIPVQTRNGKRPSPPAVSWLGIPASSIIPDVRTEAGERFLPSTAIFPEALERTRIFTAYTGWTVPLAGKRFREAGFLPPVKPEGLLDHRSGG